MALNAARNNEAGNAILFLFIAVALFGMISYAFLQGSRGNLGMITGEAGKAASYMGQDCANSVDMATKRLRMRGCATISYNPDGTGTNPDGSCSVFHPKGGGAKACTGFTVPPCTVTTVGGICPDGTIYAGISPDGGKRMYTTAADGGMFAYNNGNATGLVYTNVTNFNTGKANTDFLAATDSDSGASGFQPHQAAAYCYNFVSNGHEDWYLPAMNELIVLCTNKNDIGGFNLTGNYGPGWYRSSNDTELNGSGAFRFSDCGMGGANSRPHSINVRCIRRDD